MDASRKIWRRVYRVFHYIDLVMRATNYATNPSCGASMTNVIKFNYKLSKLLENSTDYRGNDQTIRRAVRETGRGLLYIAMQLFCKPNATMGRRASSARDKSVLR